MSGFGVAPCQGHLDRLRRICGYLSKMKQGCIRVRTTDEPDSSDMSETEYDWAMMVYGRVKEEFPSNAPKPLGKPVVMTTYVDANLYQDMMMGRSVSAVLHFFNQTPIEWFSKKQATVETATYGLEFVAAKLAVQQIIGLRTYLHYLGVTIKGSSSLFGDCGHRRLCPSFAIEEKAVAFKAVDFQNSYLIPTQGEGQILDKDP
jgi:hypothetical protein